MSNYLLSFDQYTLCNALCWRNSYNHYNNFHNEQNSYWKSVFHFTVALIEAIPLVGQIVSLAEYFIGVLYYYYFPEPAPPLPIPFRLLPFEKQPLEVFDAQRYGVNYIGPMPTPPNNDVYLERCPNAKRSERGFLYQECNFTDTALPRVLWVHILSCYLGQDALDMRISHSFNTLIVLTPDIAKKLAFTRRQLFTIAPKFFQLVGSDLQDAQHQLQTRIRLIQRLLNEVNNNEWCTITPDTISITKEEFRTTPRYLSDPSSCFSRVGLLRNGHRSFPEYHLIPCPRSTRESLFVQFLFLYAIKPSEPLTVDSTFYVRLQWDGGRSNQWKGEWSYVFNYPLTD